MILSGVEIKKRLGKENKIETNNKKALNPNSYNIRNKEEL